MSDNEQEAEPQGPRARDLERADTPTAWQRAQAERKAEREAAQDDPGDASDEQGEELSETKRAELLRCAEAFEHTAAKLREIVGE